MLVVSMISTKFRNTFRSTYRNFKLDYNVRLPYFMLTGGWRSGEDNINGRHWMGLPRSRRSGGSPLRWNSGIGWI